MAELKVEVLEIVKVINHPNADRLDIATVQGYDVVVGRDFYKAGDSAVYFPVDSIIPPDLEECIFADTKMKLSKSRVRAARIRGAMSFGLLVDIPRIKKYIYKDVPKQQKIEYYPVGKDLTKHTGVTKYEPPVKGSPQRNLKQVAKRYQHPDFSRYTDIQHGKKNLKAIAAYDGPVVLTEKIHGTNFRCGWVPFKPRTWKQKLLKVLTDWTCWNFVPEYEFVYGSHNVQLQDGNPKPGKPAHDNVYKRAVKEFDLTNKTHDGELWYFEIFGNGIQENYSYCTEPGEIGIRVIDIKHVETNARIKKGFMCWEWVVHLSRARGLEPAPTLTGFPGFDEHKFEHTISAINGADGKAALSRIDGKTPIEGGVLRPLLEEVQNYTGRYIYKFISDEYLLNKSNTDNH